MSRDDYNEVSQRILEFREKHPNGCLRPADPSKPFDIVTIGEQTFIVVVAAAYRSPDDQMPGIGMAWEPCPGRTNFTRLSELQNCETSAWGRALIAVGAADAKKGIASADEVRNRARDASANATRVPDSRSAQATSDARSDHGQPRMISPAMTTKLQIMLGEAGYKERGEKLQFCENLVQRPLSSSKDLTMDEGRLIIDVLQQAANEPHTEDPSP